MIEKYESGMGVNGNIQIYTYICRLLKKFIWQITLKQQKEDKKKQ